MKRFLEILGFITLIGLFMSGVSACFSDSDAASGPTQAEFDELKAEVQALRDSATRDLLYGSNNTISQKAGAKTPLGEIGTVLQYSRVKDGLSFSTVVTLINASDYYIPLPMGRSVTKPEQVAPLTGESVPMYFNGSGCTGTAYVHSSSIAPELAMQGFVIGFHPGGSETSTDIFMVRPDSGKNAAEVTYLSYNAGPFGACQEKAGTLPAELSYTLEPNDPAVSGEAGTDYGTLTHSQ